MPAANNYTCAACHGLIREKNFLGAGPSYGFVYGDCTYARCPGCAGIQLCPLPARETNEAFETEETAEQMASIDDRRLEYLRRRLGLLRLPPRTGPPPRLLDVGCSTGRLMGLAQAAGWDVTGIEMSPPLAAETLRYLPGAAVMVGDILQMELADIPPFDAIVALDVIEHVLDPNEFLRRLHGLLVPGGQLLLHTPNARSARSRVYRGHWNMLIPEYHFHLFSANGMGQALRRAGFRLERVFTASGGGTETGVAAMAARAKERLLNLGTLGNALVVKAMRR